MEIKNWEDFEEKIKEIDFKIQGFKNKKNAPKVSTPLFRGQSNANNWKLETTLDRLQKDFSVEKYYRTIRNIKSAIKSCTSKHWQLPDIAKDLAQLDKKCTISQPSYEFMAYLRHNRFPSPLLDWTRSPYIAAFFAFNEDKRTDPAIYVYIQFIGEVKVKLPLFSSNDPKIYSLGPNVTTHKRHHLQQSEYTFCKIGSHGRFFYRPHEVVFSRQSKSQNLQNLDQDYFEKWTLSYSKRTSFLKKLNQMNINAYSLFEDEERLMNKLANEELLFKNL